jgi:aryl-alcohol dehydrogenase (NADP+)
VCAQPQYSVFARSVEQSVLTACQRHRMAGISWSPFAGGRLTGKYRRGELPSAGSRFDPGGRFMQGSVSHVDDLASPARFDAPDALREFAGQAGLSLTELALVFVGSHPAIASTIIGPRAMQHLEDALSAADVRRGTDVLDVVDKVVPPGSDMPGVDHFLLYPTLRPEFRRRPESRPS